METLSFAFYTVLVAGGVLFVYFIPALTAHDRGVKNFGSIVVINIFLGWTIIGWVVALAMACADVNVDKDKK